METLLPFVAMGIGVVALAAIALVARMRAAAAPETLPPVRTAEGRPAVPRVTTQGAAAPSSSRSPAAARSPVTLAAGLMPIVISVLVLLSALYVVLLGAAYSDAQQKWAFGAIGTLLGYWLKK